MDEHQRYKARSPLIFKPIGFDEFAFETNETSTVLDSGSLQVVSYFSTAHTIAEATAFFRDSLEISDVDFLSVVHELVLGGLLVSATDEHPGREDAYDWDDYFVSYADLATHRSMIRDHARTAAFKSAIEEVVTSGDVVLDLGTGSGILSLFAAACEAEKVHAIDNASIIHVANEIAARNGVTTISFLHELAEATFIDGKVDVIVSEWLGFFALEELMFRSFVDTRERYLKPNGRVIPASVQLFLAPIEDSKCYLESGPGLWERPVFGFDFEPMFQAEMRTLHLVTTEIERSSYLADAQLIADLDCIRSSVADFYFESEIDFEIERTGTMHGFAGHFDAILSPSVTLSTSPESAQTHWNQAYFAIPSVHVVKGDHLALRFAAVDPERTRATRTMTYFIQGELSRGDAHVLSFAFCYSKDTEAVGTAAPEWFTVSSGEMSS
jgi:hypothetical protein